jgi:anti-anti-sigma factor
MELRAEQVGSALVLHLDGRMSAESDTAWMRDAVRAFTAPGVRHALLDLAGVRQLDCAGIGQLLALRERVHGARRTFGLVEVERRQRRMLELSGLIHVFRVFGDRDAAVSALGLGGGRPCEDRLDAAPGVVFSPGRVAARWRTARGWPETECVS